MVSGVGLWVIGVGLAIVCLVLDCHGALPVQLVGWVRVDQ